MADRKYIKLLMLAFLKKLALFLVIEKTPCYAWGSRELLALRKLAYKKASPYDII